MSYLQVNSRMETTSNMRSNSLLRINSKLVYLCCLPYGFCLRIPITGCTNWLVTFKITVISKGLLPLIIKFLCIKSTPLYLVFGGVVIISPRQSSSFHLHARQFYVFKHKNKGVHILLFYSVQDSYDAWFRFFVRRHSIYSSLPQNKILNLSTKIKPYP